MDLKNWKILFLITEKIQLDYIPIAAKRKKIKNNKEFNLPDRCNC